MGPKKLNRKIRKIPLLNLTWAFPMFQNTSNQALVQYNK